MSYKHIIKAHEEDDEALQGPRELIVDLRRCHAHRADLIELVREMKPFVEYFATGEWSKATNDAINHFGSLTALADALDISRSAVSQWGKHVPDRKGKKPA